MAGKKTQRPQPIPGVYTTYTGQVELRADKYSPGDWELLVNGVPSSHIAANPAQLEYEYMRWIAAIAVRHIDSHLEPRLAACGKGKIVTLDIPGKPWTTEQLARQLEGWKNDGRDVCLLVGGPEGLSPECKAAAEQSWSLSPLTLPHPLVRVVVAKSLYRAWSLSTNHPYHRE